jgi:molybdate transport system regulatory protein
MNKLKGKIIAVNTVDEFSQIQLEVGAALFVSIVIAISEINPSLKIGNFVSLLFKETDVSICKNMPEMISIPNRIPVIIKAKEKGILLTRLQLAFNKQKINAVVPSAFAKEVPIGEEVIMLIRSNEIMLME